MSRPAVFLDRDGTIIEDVSYLRDVSEIDLLPWAAGAIRQLTDAGFVIVVVTNQSGVARGYFDEALVAATHEALDVQLAAQGARIDSYYYCPHYPISADPRYGIVCDCRKPFAGMLHRAARELNVDLSRSWMVGDSWSDVQAGLSAGTRSILIRSGRGTIHKPAPAEAAQPDAILNNLMEAAEWILRSSLR
jgi:D-glycero-D-manno-heptose 1,7-bisphosphate phosphatase